jgi:CubicO group peptidase (beta-lactamase class C family)
MDERFQKAFVPVEHAVVSGRIPGAVLGIIESDGTRTVQAIGAAQTVPSHRQMTRETWFDLASLTKVIWTTTCILELADAGTIDLDAPLISVLPDLRQYAPNAWERKVTFRQCLGHQTPFPAVEPVYTYGRDPDLLRAFILQREWKAGPAVYSDINFILLGFALERIHKVRRLRELDPGPGFAWEAPADTSAATEDCTWRHEILSGTVHDDNCHALEGSGHAGLFGTADAVLDFALGLLTGTGASQKTIELVRTPLSATRTHGWEHPHIGWSGGDRASPETIGHTGFTGTGLWIDFSANRAWTLLTNRVHPTRHFDSGIFELRRIVGDAINA